VCKFLCQGWGGERWEEGSPIAWMTKDTTSPATKIFVMCERLIRAYDSARRRIMMRPRTMYMDAAYSAGASRMRTVWRMYGART